MTILLFVLSLLIIVVASELFTNAIEWAGFRMHLGTGATGSLLAALGTSLPEFTVPVVALLTHTENANAVAIGAVLGAPLLLLTLGVGITGVAVIMRHSNTELTINPAQARRDLGVFVVAFTLSSLAALFSAPPALRVPLGIGLCVLYTGYVLATLRDSSSMEAMPEPLHIIRWDADREAGRWSVTVQLAIAVGMLVGGSDLFVAAINQASSALKLPALIVALVLVPIATELPETMNSVLWVRSDDDGLAFGNVAGSATFQACILGMIGLCFTTWNPGRSGLISAGLTLLTAIYLLTLLRDGRTQGRWLLLAVVPWCAYVVIAVVGGAALAAA